MVPPERTRSQFCCGLWPNGYRSASSIPTSTACGSSLAGRSVRTYGYEFAEALLDDGVAYDPVMDSWRMPTEALPHAPRTSHPFGESLRLSVSPTFTWFVL